MENIATVQKTYLAIKLKSKLDIYNSLTKYANT